MTWIDLFIGAGFALTFVVALSIGYSIGASAERRKFMGNVPTLFPHRNIQTDRYDQ